SRPGADRVVQLGENCPPERGRPEGTSVTPSVQTTIHHRIAEELGVSPRQVGAAVELLDGGATVPFVARYRKEATGGMDDTQLRKRDERLRYLRELEDRRATILESIREQGKLTDELKERILAADSKARLEDIYLPYKPKRRTKGQIAREAGLEPLADTLLSDPTHDPETTAAQYVDADKGVADTKAALDGARAILIERFAEDADLVGELRERMWTHGYLVSRVRPGKETEGAKYADYFDFSEPFTKLVSHRIRALFRGEKEEILELSTPADEPVGADGEPADTGAEYERIIAARFGIADEGRPADQWLMTTARWAWRTKIHLHLSIDLRMRLRQIAEDEAVRVFAANLRDLLLAAPAGTHLPARLRQIAGDAAARVFAPSLRDLLWAAPAGTRPTIGLDPGYRTGVKVAVVDGTGKLVDTATIYPHQPQQQWEPALATLRELAVKHDIELIAIGNGTASRETDKLAAELIRRHPELKLTKAVVSEAGASVYSA